MPPPAPRIYRSNEVLFGTVIEIILEGCGPESRLEADSAKAFDLIRSVQRLMDYHHAESDVFRVNQCARLAPMRVHPWTWHVLERALRLCAETEGAFDVTLAPVMVRGGVQPRHRDAMGMGEAGRWEDVALLDGHGVFLRSAIKIDLGTIARGYAVDKAIDFLSTRGLTRAVVNAGGDLRVCGAGPHRFPSGGMELPGALLRPAVATNAAFFARKRLGVARAAPVVHPRTGKPLRSNQSVSVFAPTCAEADALTRAVLLAPQPVWNRALREHDSLALFLTNRGEQVLFPA